MGWTTMRKPDDVAEWFREKFTRKNENGTRRVLDVAIVNRSEAYAAVEDTKPDGTREVWAATYLIQFYPNAADGCTFGYKDMSEHMGPGIASCPARILDLLTPTDSEYANRWREDCRARLERRAANKLKVGDYIRFAEPLTYGKGAMEVRTFAYAQDGRRTFFYAIDEETGGRVMPVRIRNWRDRTFEKLTEEQVAEMKAGAAAALGLR